ncbi:hypothetical protein BJ546DRAFT_1062901 [Cryomyces antarcticus]
MLDENLPTFFLKPSPDDVKHHQAFYLSQYGAEPEAAYALHHLDPLSPSSKNCYAAALFDSYSPEILYGEVLVRPGWTQPSLSQEQIRLNGGVPPPPQPIMPTEFVIQLYNPDQQVHVTQKPGTWGGSASYEFSMPQSTFRTPSASTLDRSQSDPVVAATTPRVNFVWKKESKLSKDLTCFLTGKSTDLVPGGKKKGSKEPDIAVALFKGLKEMSVYEPNLYRVEMEDPKGLEVVLLLGAAVIKDLYFGSIKEAFNITDPVRKLSASGRKLSSPSTANLKSVAPPPPPTSSQSARPQTTSSSAAVNGLYVQPSPPQQSRNKRQPQSLPQLQTTPPPAPPAAQPKPVDPLAEWAINAETARLRARAAAEERQRREVGDARRRERDRAAEAETRRLRKMVEAEEKGRRARQAEVERETERLRRLYGQQSLPGPVQQPVQRPGPFTGHSQSHRPHQRPHSSAPASQQRQQPVPQQARPQPQRQRLSNGLYLQPATATATSASAPTAKPHAAARKKSLWGLRSASSECGATATAAAAGNKLAKKKSSMF